MSILQQKVIKPMENNDKNKKELLFLEPFDKDTSEEEQLEKLVKILESLGFKVIDKENS